MAQSLADRVAEKVLRECLQVRPGEGVTIETWNTGLEFAKRVAVQTRRIGAIPVLLFEDEEAFVEAVERGPRASAGQMGRHEYALLSRTDAYVFIPGPLLGGAARLSTARVSTATAYNSSWYGAARKARIRGARMLFGYVGPELAAVLGRPLRQVVEQQMAASLTDLRRVRGTASALSKRLKAGAKVTLRSSGESLHFELGGEEAFDDGTVSRADLARGANMTNVPPGYYARAIVPSSLEGGVRLYAPVPRISAMADLHLLFRRGRLEQWESDKDPRWLDRLVEGTPKDRRTLAALAVGLNPTLVPGCGQDRLVEGAVSFFGLFQSTARTPTLEANGRALIRDGRIVRQHSIA